jgi:hypothetical protein
LFSFNPITNIISPKAAHFSAAVERSLYFVFAVAFAVAFVAVAFVLAVALAFVLVVAVVLAVALAVVSFTSSF